MSQLCIFFVFAIVQIIHGKLNNNVLFINIQNECDINCLANIFWNNEYSTNNIFVTESNNTVSFDINNADIIDVDLDVESYDLCYNTSENMFIDAFNAARTKNIEPLNFDFQMILIPSNIKICEWRNRTTTFNCPNSDGYCGSVINAYNSAIFAHAIGHNLGLVDGTNQSYWLTDYSTVMSYSHEKVYYYTYDISNAAFFNALQRFYLGWIDQKYKFSDPYSDSSITITALSTNTNELTDGSILMTDSTIITDGGTYFHMFLSYRSNFNADSNLKSDLQNKIHVYMVSNLAQERWASISIFDRTLGEYESMTFHNFNVKVTKITQTYATVYFGKCIRNLPTLNVFLLDGFCNLYFSNNNNNGCTESNDTYMINNVIVGPTENVTFNVVVPNNVQILYSDGNAAMNIEISSMCNIIIDASQSPSVTDTPTNSISYTKSVSYTRSVSKTMSRTKSASKTRSRTKSASRSKTMSKTMSRTKTMSKTRSSRS